MPRARPASNRRLARRADRHALYERAVQDPARDVQVLARWFRRIRGRVPRTLREDFCGTAVLCAEWARSRRDRTAYGVDLDEATLRWGLRHRIEAAGVATRVHLEHADVRARKTPRVDLTCALNFSYCALHERADLVAYFRAARAGLRADGLLVLDVLGGRDSMIEDETRHDLGDFVYVWEQAMFDALTHRMTAHIHFEFPDGSALRRAFSYDWRLWTVPELRDALREAGFSRVRPLWEKEGPGGEETGIFYEPRRPVPNQDVWWTYLLVEP